MLHIEFAELCGMLAGEQEGEEALQTGNAEYFNNVLAEMGSDETGDSFIHWAINTELAASMLVFKDATGRYDVEFKKLDDNRYIAIYAGEEHDCFTSLELLAILAECDPKTLAINW